MKEIEEKLASTSLTPEERIALAESRKMHSMQCKDLYHNIAIHFAELHDMPGLVLKLSDLYRATYTFVNIFL